MHAVLTTGSGAATAAASAAAAAAGPGEAGATELAGLAGCSHALEQHAGYRDHGAGGRDATHDEATDAAVAHQLAKVAACATAATTQAVDASSVAAASASSRAEYDSHAAQGEHAALYHSGGCSGRQYPTSAASTTCATTTATTSAPTSACCSIVIVLILIVIVIMVGPTTKHLRRSGCSRHPWPVCVAA